MESREAWRDQADSDAQPRTDLSGALHEVSNTLTVVLGWLECARSRVADGAALEAIDVAMTHARLGHSVARRAIGADVDDHQGTRSALAVAKDAVLGVDKEAERHGVTVRVDDEEAADLLLSAAPSCLQVLVNLLLNAISFSPRGGLVTLSVGNRRGSIVFSVSDSGPGIPEERVATLFSAPVSTRSGGAGIGLRHSHGLARSNGGELLLAETSARGSCFELRWPCQDAPSGALHRSVPPPAIDGMRVLVLEDDPAVLALVELGLEGRGASVAAATTEQDLERALARGVFDAVLVDLSPLETNPRKALLRWQTAHPDLPIVIISGSATPDVDPTGVAAWVRKPFEVGELVDALVRVRSGS